MKKSIAFLLLSLAASSSLLFHKTEAKKSKGEEIIKCRTGKDIIVLENQGGKFKIFDSGKRKSFKLMTEKKALKEFKKLCKGGGNNDLRNKKKNKKEDGSGTKNVKKKLKY